MRPLHVDTLFWWGIGPTVAGFLATILLYPALPGWELATVFLPQIIVGCGNGLLLAKRDGRGGQCQAACLRHRLRHHRLHADGGRGRGRATVGLHSSAADTAMPLLC